MGMNLLSAKHFAKNASKFRAVNEMTQQELSELTEVSVRTIQRIENAKRNNSEYTPTIGTLTKFAEAAQTSLTGFLDGRLKFQ